MYNFFRRNEIFVTNNITREMLRLSEMFPVYIPCP